MDHSVDHPMNMGVKAYNGIILIADIIVLLTTWLYLTLESMLRTIIPPSEVDVSGDIVLVSSTIRLTIISGRRILF